uniref:Odorant receptor n=1 Tax=Athetis dissimilis TaxID=1737331 RepID=A0A0S1TL39_ATHDI|nr:odorant receptor 85 [Athetis dissimilis]
MNELPEVPKEFIEPLLLCFGLLQNASIYIYDTEKCIRKKYFHLILNMVTVGPYLCALTMYLGKVFRGELQRDELAYVMSIYVVSVQALLKAAIVRLKAKEIRAIILGMGSMWRTEGLTEVQISKKNALLKRLKFCYAVFYWMNIIGSWQYILASLLETVFRKFILQQECGLLLPFSCSFPFDPTGNWIRYISVYIFETYSMFRIIYSYLGTEFLMITMCSHLATLFTLLQEELLNNKPGNHVHLKVIIKTHQKLISLSEQLDDVFDKVIFVNLSSASISMCFFGLSAKVAHGAIPMANNFVAVVVLTLPLFNLCYYGEKLREASAGLADSVYNNIWYRGDTRYQQFLWFIMRRSQKPCCLTSLKYNPITLNTFTTVLSTTWSYFSLALSVYEDES